MTKFKNYFNRLLYLSWRLVLAIILASVISIVYLQEDPWIKEKLEKYINNTMKVMLKCNFSCKLKKINLFTGQIELTDIDTSSYNKTDWSLNIPLVSFCLSFRDLILNLEPNVVVYCYKANLNSTIKNNKFAFIDAVNSFLEYPSVLPISLKFLALESSCFNLYDINSSKNLSLLFNGITTGYSSFIKLNISCISGKLNYYNQNYFDNIKGSLNLDIPLDGSDYLDNLNLNISLDLPLYKSNSHSEAHCYLRGEYKEKQGLFRLNNSKQTIKFSCLLDLSLKEKDLKFNGFLPLNLFKPLVNSRVSFINCLSGSSIIQGHFNFNNNLCTNNGSFTVNLASLCVNKTNLGNWSLNGNLDDCSLSCNLNVDSDFLPVKGLLQYDFKSKVASIFFDNYKKLKFYNYSIDSTKSNIKAEIDQNFNIKNLTTNITSCSADGKVIKSSLRAVQNNNLLNFKVNSNNYVIKSSLDIQNKQLKSLKLKDLSVKDKDNSCLLYIDHNGGQVDYILLKKLFYIYQNLTLDSCLDQSIGDFSSKFISGQGKFNFKYNNKNNLFNISLILNNGDIRLPWLYNILKNLYCDISFDFRKNILTAKNIKLDFYQGSISSLRSTFYLDNSYKLYYVNMPLILKNFLVNYKRQFLGLVSGDINLDYNTNNKSSVIGNLTLGKSKFDGTNISNSNVKSELTDIINSDNHITVDLNLESKVPLSINFGSLEANSRVNINIGGFLSNPKWSGQLDLIDGKVNFAYKPLFISYGKILLNSSNISNSSINFTAKNRVKNYNINLFVNGSFNDLQLKLDSSPSLEQEQIIALLLGGNSQGALYAAMPQMLIQAFESYIPGKNNTVKSIFKPLKNIRFIPVNTQRNNSGSSEDVPSKLDNIAGALEIDISDNLRASIETDLSFTENPRVEVDYAISDDISIKGARSSKGDLEAEVEMRWKF